MNILLDVADCFTQLVKQRLVGFDHFLDQEVVKAIVNGTDILRFLRILLDSNPPRPECP